MEDLATISYGVSYSALSSGLELAQQTAMCSPGWESARSSELFLSVGSPWRLIFINVDKIQNRELVMKIWIQKHQLLSFFTLSYAIMFGATLDYQYNWTAVLT